MNGTQLYYTDVMAHHGVLGQKWGVRRYQNKDGSLTTNGRKRYSGLSKEQKSRIMKASVAGISVAAAALYLHKHPEKGIDAIGKISNIKISDLSDKAISAGKKATKSAIINFKSGIVEGINEGPKKLGKAIVVGLVLNEGKKYLDSVVGKEESAKIFQANNGKKIDKFWKVSDDRDRDDDD